MLELGENFGFAEGYNRAVAALDYPYVVLLNSDVEVTPDWWRPMLGLLENNPEVGAVQPKILSYRDRSSFEYAGAAGGYIDALGYPWCRGRLFDRLERDEGQYNGAPLEVAWASGACMAMPLGPLPQTGRTRRQLLRPHGGDRLMCEDTARRTEGGGHQRFSRLSCGRSLSLNQGNPEKTYLNFRNNLLLLHKNLPRQKGRRILLFRRLADTLAFGLFLLKGDMPNARAILRAHSDFRKMKKSLQ